MCLSDIRHISIYIKLVGMAPSSSSPSRSPSSAAPTKIPYSNDVHTPNPEDALWRMETIPGKGKGVIATRDISPGTLILSDPPLITTAVIQSIETTEQDLARALRALPKDSQRAFLSLHNNHRGEKNPLSNIVRSNGYPLGPGSDVGAVFAHVSRFNHSCVPNAKHAWNAALGHQTVYAIRPVAAGQEITLSYLHGGTFEERQRELSSLFGFTCACELCSLRESARAASDARLERARELNDAMGDYCACRSSPGRVLALGRELVRVYRAEDVVAGDDRLANVYWDLFQVCAMHGDGARARAFAGEYAALKRAGEGPLSAAAAEGEEVARRPDGHAGFGKTRQWASSVEDVPKGLGKEGFEKWMFREV